MAPLSNLALVSSLLSTALAHPTNGKLKVRALDKSPLLADYSAFDASHDRQPPFSDSVITPFPTGTFPQYCKDVATAARSSSDSRPNCEIAKLEAYSIKYNDCPTRPWAVCRCSDAQLAIQDIANGFGRVPPGVRSRVVHFIVVDGSQPDGTISKSAGSSNDRVTFRGPIDDAVYVHESFHSVDQGFSSTSTFTDAINADSCVPDNYAQTSPQEDFAQLGVWDDYDTNAPTKVASYIGKDYSCLQNQLNAVKTYAAQWYDLTVSACFDRRPDDANVTASTTASAKEGVANVESVNLEVGAPIEYEFWDEF